MCALPPAASRLDSGDACLKSPDLACSQADGRGINASAVIAMIFVFLLPYALLKTNRNHY
jgi:hypothetical protein